MTCILAGFSAAQGTDEAEQLRLGRAAMAAHDPAAAIAHFERVDTREGRESLAAALMTESRSASDDYVERAFAAAMRARAEHPPSRVELAAAVRPGEMAIVYLIGETAWAWAFDRDAFVGYPLAPDAIATAAGRAQSYIDRDDREGVARVADDLMPALLGPAMERLPKLTRIIFVVDGPLRNLPIGVLPAGAGQPPLQQQLAVSIAEHGALLDAIKAAPLPPVAHESRWYRSPVAIAAALATIVLTAIVLLRR
jgi:hypothetical protein